MKPYIFEMSRDSVFGLPCLLWIPELSRIKYRTAILLTWSKEQPELQAPESFPQQKKGIEHHDTKGYGMPTTTVNSQTSMAFHTPNLTLKLRVAQVDTSKQKV